MEQFPYIEAEIQYAVKEYACTIVDFLARRTRLAFLNAEAAADAIPKIADVMAKELKWSKAKKEVINNLSEKVTVTPSSVKGHALTSCLGGGTRVASSPPPANNPPSPVGEEVQLLGSDQGQRSLDFIREGKA